MKLPRYTVDVFHTDARPFDFVVFKYPIAWNAQGKPTHWGEERHDCADIAQHETCSGFIHVLRVKSLTVPPIQPPS